MDKYNYIFQNIQLVLRLIPDYTINRNPTSSINPDYQFLQHSYHSYNHNVCTCVCKKTEWTWRACLTRLNFLNCLIIFRSSSTEMLLSSLTHWSNTGIIETFGSGFLNSLLYKLVPGDDVVLVGVRVFRVLEGLSWKTLIRVEIARDWARFFIIINELDLLVQKVAIFTRNFRLWDEGLRKAEVRPGFGYCVFHCVYTVTNSIFIWFYKSPISIYNRFWKNVRHVF